MTFAFYITLCNQTHWLMVVSHGGIFR